MANPVLGKLQGQGLFETTTSGIQQAGGTLAVTPVGAAMQGRGPDSQKMAGTQPAKINALRAGLQDVQSQALGELRERGAGALTAEQQARAEAAKSATVLGRVDDRIAQRVEARTKSNLLGLKLTGAELDTEKLPGYDNAKLTELRKSINDLISGTDLTDSDISEINAAIKAVDPQGTLLEFDPAKLPSAPVMAASLSTLFKNKTTAELTSEIGNAISSAKDSATIGALDNEDAVAILGEGKTKDDLVALISSVTGKDATAIAGMQLAEVRAAIQNWKDTEFKDVAKLRQDLNSAMTSPARRQLALTELRRLGQLELTAAEAKVGNLEQQMKEGDEVKIGTEVFTVEELFKDPAKLLQLQTWADNPDTAPPELKAFLTANAGAIQQKVDEIIGAGDTGLMGAIDTVKTNAETFKLDDSVADIPSELVDKYFPGWGNIGLNDKKSTVTQAEVDAMPATTDAERAAKAAKQADLDKTLKYGLLQNPATAQSMKLLMGNLGTIPGIKGTDVFNKLTYAQMQLLSSNEQRVNDFVLSLKNQNSVKNFKTDPATLPSEFRFLSDGLGLGASGKQLSNLFGKNLSAYKDIFTRAGLGGLLNADGTFNFNAIQTELNGLRDASFQELIDGKASTVRDSLINKVDVLFREIGRAPQRYEQFPDTPQKAEQKFAEDKGIKSPKVILAEKEALRNQLGGENHQNYLEYNETVKWAFTKKPEMPFPSKYQSPANYEKAMKEYRDTIDKINNAIKQLDTVTAKFKDSERRFNAANDDWNNYQNNYTKEVTNYQDAYDAWAADYRSKLKTKNDGIQKTYDDLQDLLRGAF